MKYVYLVSGKATSGKDTFSTFLRDRYLNDNKRCDIIHFADQVKVDCIKDFSPITKYLNNYADYLTASIENIFNIKDLYKNPSNEILINNIISDIKKIKIDKPNFYSDKTVLSRLMMTVYGTDIVRTKAGDNYWVDIVKKKIEDYDGDCLIISDCRYLNEIDPFISNEDIKYIRVRIDKKVNIDPLTSNHSSETDLDNYECWDYEIDNNGTIDNLRDSSIAVYENVNTKDDLLEYNGYVPRWNTLRW